MKHRAMKNCLQATVLCLMGLLLFCHPGQAQITLDSLLEEMTDLERLAELPELQYTTRQFSSYDRRSTDPDELTDENWFANADAGQFIRTEETDHGTEYVMMDIEGPGAIVRIWSANADEAGVLRFYFDGEETPSIEMPFADMLRGDVEPFISPIAGIRGRGWNSYLPIPYAESLKITADNTPFYYIINYRTYEAETEVETFSLSQAMDSLPQIREVAEAMEAPKETVEQKIARHQTERYRLELDAGDSMTFDAIEGPGAIYRLTAQLEAENTAAALRAMMLEITFDGQESPAVMTPLGDFFGTAPGENPYQGLPAGYTEEDGFYAHWVMPFAEEAVIQLHNHSDQEVILQGHWTAGPWDWNEDSLYFHAKWRHEWELSTRPRQDWNFADLQGQGRYVGNMLAITNPTMGWWGEGDEKIYVDGENFPSHFGTGTEDYYGYAWGDTALYSHAYHSQTHCQGPQRFGHTSVNRFHIMDDIPYQESLRFDMEVWHWEEVDIHQAAISYWYARNNADNFDAPAAEALIVPEPEGINFHVVEGAHEGESMQVKAVSGGETTIQYTMDFKWSNIAQLWWTEAAPGDVLELGFEVEEAGDYRITPGFTHAPDYGIVSLEINGDAVDGEFDLYAETISNPELESLGVFALEEGENTLKVTIEGKNPEAVPSYMFGLDYLLLESVD